MFAAAFGSSLQAEYIHNIDPSGSSCNPAEEGQSLNKSRKSTRPPRIRVPNHERALFTVSNQKFVE
jgi:hypothetical protein